VRKVYDVLIVRKLFIENAKACVLCTGLYMRICTYIVCETVSIPFAFLSKRENEKAGKSTLFIDCTPSKLN